MKTRLAVVFLLGGLGLVLVAAVLKIQHWTGASLLILAGLALQAAGGLLLLARLLAPPAGKQPLNQ